MLIGWIAASYLCTSVGGQQFRRESRKLRTRIMCERYYSFFHNYLLSCSYVMVQKRVLSKPEWGGHKQSIGEADTRSVLLTNSIYSNACRHCYALLAKINLTFFATLPLITRGGVEDTRLEAKAKDAKKSEAKAKDQEHKRKCFPKKNGLQKTFSLVLQ